MEYIALCENATEIRAPVFKFQACSDFVDPFNFSERMGAHPKSKEYLLLRVNTTKKDLNGSVSNADNNIIFKDAFNLYS